MNTSCCVVECSNSYRNTKGKGVSFHRFPTKPYERERRMRWILAIGRVKADGTPWEPSKSSVVCGEHFIGGKPSNIENHPDYIPSVFNPIYKKRPHRESAIKRHDRALKRRKLAEHQKPSTSAISIIELEQAGEHEAPRTNKESPTIPSGSDLSQNFKTEELEICAEPSGLFKEITSEELNSDPSTCLVNVLSNHELLQKNEDFKFCLFLFHEMQVLSNGTKQNVRKAFQQVLLQAFKWDGLEV